MDDARRTTSLGELDTFLQQKLVSGNILRKFLKFLSNQVFKKPD